MGFVSAQVKIAQAVTILAAFGWIAVYKTPLTTRSRDVYHAGSSLLISALHSVFGKTLVAHLWVAAVLWAALLSDQSVVVWGLGSIGYFAVLVVEDLRLRDKFRLTRPETWRDHL